MFFLNASKQARVLPEAAAARSGSVTCGRQEGTENAETVSGRLAAAAKANLTASTAASEKEYTSGKRRGRMTIHVSKKGA